MKTIKEIWNQFKQGVPVGQPPVLIAGNAKPATVLSGTIPQITHHRNVMTIQKARTPGKSIPIPLVVDTNFTLIGARQCGKTTVQTEITKTLIQRYTQQRNWIRFQLRGKTKKGPKRKAF